MIFLLAAAAQVCLPSRFRFWLPLPPCLPSLSPFMISLLAAAAALSVQLVTLHDIALGCRCRLVSQAYDFSPDSSKLQGFLLLNGWVS